MSNSCCGGKSLIFACSGAADVGAIADRAARKLTLQGTGKMFCLAGVGGRVPGIMKTTQGAEQVLAIDGCPLNCVRNCLEQAGITGFSHLQLAGIGMEKGGTPANDENVNKAVVEAEKIMRGESD